MSGPGDRRLAGPGREGPPQNGPGAVPADAPRAPALYPGMAAAFSGMGRPFAENAAAQKVFADFESASAEGIGHLALEAGESELHRDRAWELAVVAAEVAGSALGVTRLPVRWPLHTSLMSLVATALGSRRRTIGRLRRLRHPVYSGLGGTRMTTPSEGWALLVRHLVRHQRLDLAVPSVVAAGNERFVELGPGTTLARAVRRLARTSAMVESFALFEGVRVGRVGSRC